MSRSRKTDLTVGSEAYSVQTELVAGETPAIESRVLAHGRVVYRTQTDIGEFVPASKHLATISRWIDTQHETVMAKLQDGSLSVESVVKQADTLLEAGLADALSSLAARDFPAAARKLRKILEQEPTSAEAKHLLEVARTCATGQPPPGNVRRRLRAGAEAFASGSPKRALEFWKTCLASDPACRTYQCLVLLATSASGPRRDQYAQEVISLGGQLLTEGYPEEAHALLMVAQTVERSSLPDASPSPIPEATTPGPSGHLLDNDNPAKEAHAATEIDDIDDMANVDELGDLDDVDAAIDEIAASARTLKPPSSGTRSQDAEVIPEPQPANVAASVDESPETNPRAMAAPEALWSSPDRSASRRVAAWNLNRLPLPTHYLFGIGAAVLALLILGISMKTMRGRARPVDLLEQASATLSAGHYAEATDAYTRILTNWNGVASAHLGRGRARLALGDFDGGLADLARAVELEPGAPTSSEELADVLFLRGSFQEASDYYRKAIEAGSENPDARYRLAASLVQLGRSDEAVEQLRAAIEGNPSHGEARLLLGTLLNTEGRYAEAEQELRAARPYVQGGDYFTELGLALLEQERLVGAEEVAREFLQLEPGDARAHALLGEVYLHRRDYDLARVELIRALQINERNARAQIALGRTWLRIGKTEGDRSALAKARRILETAQGAPEGERIFVLGQVALAERNVSDAVTLLERSLGIGAQELPARLSLAEARFVGRDYAEAAKELERARSLSPTDPAIPLSLAVTYSRLDDFRRASDEYLKTTELLPPHTGETLVVPHPYFSLPRRFDINRSIRNAYAATLRDHPEDPDALALKTLAESTSFAIEPAR